MSVDLRADRLAVLERLREDSRFVLVAHESPDGDAIGSLVAMQGLLTALGKDAVMFVSPDDLPLADEYRTFSLDGLIKTPPSDIADRTAVFLDCGNIDRNAVAEALHAAPHTLNIDHHHDNTRFGTIDLVEPQSSCTAEIVWTLMRELDVEPTREMVEAMYIGLITDTGRFMYDNTTPRAHEMAAYLVAAGVDSQGIYRRLYEDMRWPGCSCSAARSGRSSATTSASCRWRCSTSRTSRRSAPSPPLRGDHRRAAKLAGRGCDARARYRPGRARDSGKPRCGQPTMTSTFR